MRSNSNYASNEYFMPVMGLIDHWREKETTRDGVRITIHDFLYSDNIDEIGGPYCRHLDTDKEMKSYDATCKKLYKFLRKRTKN